MNRQQKHTILRANDRILTPEQIKAQQEEAPEDYLTEEEINEVLAPFKARGVKVEITPDHWTLSTLKQVRNSKTGEPIGRPGEVRYQGTRRMPARDLLRAVEDLMTPLTPVLPNPV